jgi:hypothetical protein
MRSSAEMHEAAERRAIAAAVFAVTGKKVDEDDPIIIAALFQAHTMREASREAASLITDAGAAVKVAVADARSVAAEASAMVKQASADRKALADSIAVQVKKAIRDAGGIQSAQESVSSGWRQLLAAMVFGALFTGGVISIACNFSFSWVADARLGSQMKRAFPHFDPVVQDKIIQYFDKPKK